MDGSTTDSSLPLRLQIAAVAVSGGANHTLAIDDQHRLWVCGSNSNGQLGLDDLLESALGSAPFNEQVHSVYAGWNHSFLLDFAGRVYAAGDNSYGQLAGIAGAPFRQISGLPPIKLVACGLRHSLFLGIDGSLWGTGCNRFGQLGLEGSAYQQATRLPFDHVDSIAAGQFHTVILTNGCIQMMGRNNHYQLASKIDVKMSRTPTNVQISERVTSISSGWNMTCALTASGKVYGWGRNNFGQLGLPPIAHVTKPTLVPDLIGSDVVKFGTEHGIALKGGECWVFGWNEHGMCGLGHLELVPPTKLLIPGVSAIENVWTGCGNTFVSCTHISNP